MNSEEQEVNLILFDLGGTLIDDPFDDVLTLIHPIIRAEFMNRNIDEDAVPEFLANWREANLKSDHQFASHFLQEETWITEALLRLHHSRAIPPTQEIPFLSLTILRKYRELAAAQIGGQPQLSVLRELLQWLKTPETVVGVASNDREFATRTMLIWGDLERFTDCVFTSEGLSRKHAGAEKPAQEFFLAIFTELNRPIRLWNRVFYVGDSEKNDIIPARVLGIRTVRFINRSNPTSASWIDKTLTSVADYQCDERGQLLEIFRGALNSGK